MKRLYRSCVVAVAFFALGAQSGTGEWPAGEWRRAAPADVGLDAKRLSELDAEIAAGKYGYIDSLLIVRHGALAFEGTYRHDYDRIYARQAQVKSGLNAHHPTGQYNYFNPWWHPYYRRGDLHTLQSVTKTVTSIVIGVAVTRNEFISLDTPVLKFFDAATVKNVDDRKRRVTIRHLLTMTAGFAWREDLPYTDPNNTTVAMEASFDWIQMAIDAPMSEEPGAVFRYNSGATQLLSYIFTAVTGKDIEEYAHEHLFKPLGISHFFWKRTPTGLADTEGGLYLRPQDLARLMYLFLRGGIWQGRVIVSADWVRDSVAPAVTVAARGVRYGYKWWLHPYGGDGKLAWAGSGFGGQTPIVIPDHDLVIVVNAWNVMPQGAPLSPRVVIDRVLAAVVR